MHATLCAALIKVIIFSSSCALHSWNLTDKLPLQAVKVNEQKVEQWSKLRTLLHNSSNAVNMVSIKGFSVRDSLLSVDEPFEVLVYTFQYYFIHYFYYSRKYTNTLLSVILETNGIL